MNRSPAIAACCIVNVPFRSPILRAMPLAMSIGQGFLFAAKSAIWYIVHQSPRNGKLLATWTTLRKNLRCSHRSDDASVEAAVSCVGQYCMGRRCVADMPRWLSGSGLLPADRQRFTNAHAPQCRQKTGLRRPATRWAMHRKVCRYSMERATRTKEPRFGSTECAARSSRQPVAQREEGDQEADRRPAGCMARHGSGAHLLARFPFFRLSSLAVLPLALASRHKPTTDEVALWNMRLCFVPEGP